ncbi:hypothetical protein TMLG_04132, partial [Mycobacterium tuberculosis SUMu012]
MRAKREAPKSRSSDR